MAAFDSDKITPLAVDEAEAAITIDGETGVVAVVPGFNGGQGGAQGRGSEAAVLPQLAAHRVAFELELIAVVDVLPLASGAPAEVRAAQLDAVWRLYEHLHDLPVKHITSPAPHIDDGFLAGDHSGDENRLVILASHGIAMRRNIDKSQRQPLFLSYILHKTSSVNKFGRPRFDK
jgi:hypothetical protein